MIMMVETIQEISDNLQTRPPPQSEQVKEEVPVVDLNLAALIAIIRKLEESVQEIKWLGK
ncbi:hypothetical protein RHMOL_Rhmol07G0188700 [Rhododendron molle]|uniref:Uncharacterized protein n=1 Tax=Rhododendron molle TaxID=49168 RepID=A0ACC0N2F8_RHOML|nr:hypothetical protein RHMOL_Rhmol07G0188700 [Rhododendron molle]